MIILPHVIFIFPPHLSLFPYDRPITNHRGNSHTASWYQTPRINPIFQIIQSKSFLLDRTLIQCLIDKTIIHIWLTSETKRSFRVKERSRWGRLYNNAIMNYSMHVYIRFDEHAKPTEEECTQICKKGKLENCSLMKVNGILKKQEYCHRLS